MDRQSFFNGVITHLRKQGRKASLYPESTMAQGCSYLLPNGDMCAIGAMIPNDHEGRHYIGGVSGLLATHPSLLSIWGVENSEDYFNSDKRFLTNLQQIHDNNLVEDWEMAFAAFANEWKLTLPEAA